MTLTLTHQEHEFLLEMLEGYLRDLRAEIVRTDRRQFKARLRQREETAEAFLLRLRAL